MGHARPWMTKPSLPRSLAFPPAPSRTTCEALKSSTRRRFKRKMRRWRWLHDGHWAEKGAAVLGMAQY